MKKDGEVRTLHPRGRPPSSTHHSPLTTHHSPLTTHHSPLTTHHSPLTTHHSPLTTHHVIAHHPPPTTAIHYSYLPFTTRPYQVRTLEADHPTQRDRVDPRRPATMQIVVAAHLADDGPEVQRLLEGLSARVATHDPNPNPSPNPSPNPP